MHRALSQTLYSMKNFCICCFTDRQETSSLIARVVSQHELASLTSLGGGPACSRQHEMCIACYRVRSGACCAGAGLSAGGLKFTTLAAGPSGVIVRREIITLSAAESFLS